MIICLSILRYEAIGYHTVSFKRGILQGKNIATPVYDINGKYTINLILKLMLQNLEGGIHLKKEFRYYLIIWAILLGVFNAAVFVSPGEVNGYSKFGGAFWSGYIFITLAFIGQLICAYFVFKADSLKKFFYKVPLIRISGIGLVLTLILGTLCMVIPNLPNWIGVILCLVVLASTAISVVKATAAGDMVSKTEEKIESKISFIKALTADAESLVSTTKTPEIKAEAKKVYEAIRYSDPVSNLALVEINEQIQSQFSAFSDAVKAEDFDLVASISNDLLSLIDSRNKKCKLLK